MQDGSINVDGLDYRDNPEHKSCKTRFWVLTLVGGPCASYY